MTPSAISRSAFVRNLLRGLTVGLVVALFAAAVDDFYYFRSSRLLATAEDAVIGLFVAAILVFYLERRRRHIEERLRLIADMNHIVCNELEIINGSARSLQYGEEIRHIQQCAQHIEWVLNQVLPGHNAEIFPPRARPERAELGDDHPARNVK